jgi:hypothetical protein
MLTGEELYEILGRQAAQVFSATTLLPWQRLSANWWQVYALVAAEVVGHAVSAPAPHVPSQLPPIQPLPTDTSWNQYYPQKPLINEQRVKELYYGGYAKEHLLKMFANLSINELERIIKEGSP